MILNPISIATQGVYSNSVSLGLASKGYIDLGLGVAETTILPGGGLFNRPEKRKQDDEKVIMAVIKQFLDDINEDL